MARRSGPGKKRAGGKGRSAGRPGRGGPGPRSAGKRPGPGARRGPSAGRPTKGKGRPDREAIVREAQAPGADGQRIVAEDQEGERWRIECLGEPVEVGSRIVFEVVGAPDAHRGQLVRLVEGPRVDWVCTLRSGPRGRQLLPFGGGEAPEFALDERATKDAPDGTRVRVTEVRKRRPGGGGSGGQRGRRRPSRVPVRVVEVLGPPGTPDSDHAALVWKHRLTTRFPRRARLEVEAIPGALPTDELARRADLRALPFITIDPARARDHDDAVFAERRPSVPLGAVGADGSPSRSAPPGRGGWTHRLWVAIADVAHFVAAGTAIDSEARRRGNSFYFPDRAIPMLPERLSSDLCSLKPDVDRLAMVVELRLAADGRVASAEFHEAVIRSRARLAYEEAADWLAESRDGSETDPARPEWGDSLQCLDEITLALGALRREEGAVELELPEVEIEVDDTGRPVDARLRTRNRAHQLIEEAMLAANRAVAAALTRAGRGTIHRVHPPPSPQKSAAFEALVARLGLSEGFEISEPGGLAALLDEVRGTPSEERIHMAALRSMSQARYASEPGGHYALQFKDYAHFTSPIRRYADLDVHRALKALLRERDHEVAAGARDDDSDRLGRLAIWLSGRERVAVDVERDAEALAACALMQGREGELFDARVMAATEFGAFVRLDAPVVSGLLPIRWLSGHWSLDPVEEVLVGERSGARIGMGDALRVELVEVDSDRARMAFRLAPRSRERGSPSR